MLFWQHVYIKNGCLSQRWSSFYFNNTVNVQQLRKLVAVASKVRFLSLFLFHVGFQLLKSLRFPLLYFNFQNAPSIFKLGTVVLGLAAQHLFSCLLMQMSSLGSNPVHLDNVDKTICSRSKRASEWERKVI